MIVKKIFLTGIFRSGTTLLTRILDAHPNIRGFYQPVTPLFRFWRNQAAQLLRAMPAQMIPPMGYPLFDAKVAETDFQEALKKAYLSSSVIDKVIQQIKIESQRDIEERTVDPDIIIKNINKKTFFENIADLYNTLGKIYNVNNICIKEVWCEEFIPLFNQDNNFKIIHIIRDVRGVTASRNTGKYLQECGGKKYPIRFIAESWNRSVEYGLQFKKFKNVMLVRYEDIILNPVETIKRITDFIEVQYVPAMLEPHNFKKRNGATWRPNSTCDINIGLNTAPLSYWRNALNECQIAVLEYLCFNNLLRMKYPLVFETHRMDLVRQYKENPEEIIDWLSNSDFLF